MVVEWSSSGLGQLAAGSAVWYRVVSKADPHAPWQEGKLAAVSDEMVQVTTLGRGSKTVTLPLKDVEPANPEMLNSVPDLTSLSHLNEPSLLHTLCNRYGTDVIYTKAGPVLIALNPCKSLPLYEAAVVNEYRQVQSDLDAQAKKPHIFLNAGKAFRDMVDNQQSQSMVISGESGAGKTETTKKAMQFFAQMSGGHGIEDQVLQTNPLLEAFGNAKTLRNHNSSRFGKLLEIHFNASNHICGAKILTYLLEKSRVVHQIGGERSFHIFYQLIRGASKEDREAWKLPDDVSFFKYLDGPNAVTTIEGVDDAKDFQEVLSAMSTVRINEDLQRDIFRIVSAVLWLGNVTFVAKNDDETRVNMDEPFQNVSELLGVPPERLVFALTHRLMTVGNETYEKTLNLEKSLDTRDALAKALYAAVFSFIVDRINSSLASEKRLSGKFIAILDIYGFESFQKNSFEQLCINYANERLQQQFNKHLFKLEQEEYTAEGIDWSHIEFVDNQDCLDTIDCKPPKGLGVMSVLDDQCNFPRSTDESFCNTIRERVKSERFSFKPGPQIDFVIDHYAGPVTYDCEGFLDKNRDTVSVDIVSALQATSSPIMQQLLPYVQTNLEGKSKATVASRFREQLLDLVSRLDCTEMHFVRCIKPNFHLKPDTFDQTMILQQLRCCGVLEVVRIAKAGYPTRYLHDQFVKRYVDLMPQTAHQKGDALSVSKALLDHFRVPESMWQIGHTKIFFRAGVLGAMEDLWRRTRDATVRIQAQMRMHVARTRFLEMRKAATTIAAHRRGQLQRRKFNVELSEHRAAVIAQANARRWLARHEAKRRMKAIIAIQCGLRKKQLRMRCAAREADMRQQIEFAQNRALRAKEKVINMEKELAEWHKIQEDFQMGPDGVRESLMAWRNAESTGSEAGAAQGTATLPEKTAKELKLFQVHREAFFAWQMGTGVDSEGASESEAQELQVWRAHRAQFFNWQQKRADGENGAVEINPGRTKKLQDHIQALRVQYEEEQQKSMKLHQENQKLKTALRPRNDPTIGPVERLKTDYSNRTDTMDDDLSFIQEVMAGASTAIPEFNAEAEIRKLKQSFDQWKETFKTRMRDTYTFVKKSNLARESRRHTSLKHISYHSHSSLRPSREDQPPSPSSDDMTSPNGENVMQKMKDGFMGYTKTGTTAIKGMVGKIQRRMAQHPGAPGYSPGYGPPPGAMQPGSGGGGGGGSGGSRSGSGGLTAAEAYARGSPSARGSSKPEQ